MIIPYHNHTFSGTSVNTDSKGSHSHKPGLSGYSFIAASTTGVSNFQYSGGNLYVTTAGNTSSDGAHTHSVTPQGSISYAGNNSTWNNGTNKNMPAYITCYIWRRTA